MRTLRVLFVLVALVALPAMTVAAQDDQYGNRSQAKSGANNVTATGCLAKGTADNEYELSTPEGTKYMLTASTRVDLSKHVGHKVEITGSPMNAKKGEAGAGSTASTSNEKHLRVQSLKHISDTCP